MSNNQYYGNPPNAYGSGVPNSGYNQAGAPLYQTAPNTNKIMTSTPAYGQPLTNPPPATLSSVPPQYGGGFSGPPTFNPSQPQQTVMPPKSNVQFFSMTSGTPTPMTSTAVAPPSIPPPPPSTINNPGFGPPASNVATPPFPGAYAGPPTSTVGPPLSVQGSANFLAAPPGIGSLYGNAPAADGQYYQSNNLVGMPSAFDNTAGGSDGLGPGGVGQSLPGIEDMDLSIQCNPAFLRPTTGKLLSTQAAATASRVPLGIICRPMAGDIGTENGQVDIVDFGSTGIVRCKRCRTYINPFVSWVENGRRWRCNICGMLNDIPNPYFSHLDQNGQRRDKDQRPELSRCSVEFVAPGDYMVRPPQPPVYFFVIDVSTSAGTSGMLTSLVTAIKNSLDTLPGCPRTQIGFITFDNSVHFYNLKSTLKAPQMLVVSDVSDLIMPSPEDLLTNLQESRAVVDMLLDSLPSMFQNNNAGGSCTGSALLAAKRVVQHVGGKLCLFQMSLPSIGEGSLKPRDNVRLIGTDKEHTLLNVDDAWYKNNAIDFSRLQIAVDVFVFSSQYTDVASLFILSKYSSGSSYYYPGFFGPRDGIRFQKDLEQCLTRATGFEAVMRVRATRGIRISGFYGNYFVRGTDLLALPNCHSDSTFALELAYDEASLQASAVTVQAALLYTTSSGERRIRVHTMVIPVTQSVPELLESVDMDCMVNLISKQAVDLSLKNGFEHARMRTHQVAVDILRSAKNPTSSISGHAQYGYSPMQHQTPVDTPLPASLQLLPLYAMSLQKCLAIRGGADVRIDERAHYQHLLSNMDVAESVVFIYPRMFTIHTMDKDAGLPTENPEELAAGPYRIKLPPINNLTSERLISDGIFLLDNGCDLFMWIGRNVNSAILSTLFGVPSLEGVDVSKLYIIPENSDYASRLNTVIEAIRSERSRYLQLNFVREGDGYAEAYFARFLVEDRANFQGGTFSYAEYHTHISRQVAGLPG